MTVSVEGLVGRERELEWLYERLRGASRGQGAPAAVLGPPGIGKSALLTAAIRAARADGFRVARASGGELEREWPHGVVRQLVAAADLSEAAQRGADSGMRALLQQRTDMMDEAEVAHGLWGLLAEAAETKPLLVVVDDVHWVDSPSLRLLAFVARRVEDLPLLLLGAARRPWDDHAADPAARALLSVCRTLSLEPLDGAAVAALAADALEAEPDAEFVDACRLSTGGNPFYLTELLHDLRHRGFQPDAEGAAAVGVLGPERVAEAALARCVAAGPDAVALAEAVAILGDGADLGRASKLAGLDGRSAAVAADALAAAALLKHEAPLSFRHPVLRAAVVSRIPVGRRGALHGQAARLLAEEGAPTGEVAGHLLASPPAGRPENALALRTAAAEAVARGATGAAIPLLQRALAEPPARGERSAVELELALAEVGMREFAAGKRLARLVRLPELSDDQVVAAARAFGAYLFSVGRGPEFRAFTEDMRPRLQRLPAIRRLRIETETLIGLYIAEGRPDDLAERLNVIERLAEQDGGRQAQGLRAFARAAELWHHGEMAEDLRRWASLALEGGVLDDTSVVGRDVAARVIKYLIDAEGEALATQAVDRLLEQARRDPPAMYAPILNARIQLAVHRGDLRAVEELLVDCPDSHIWVRVFLLLQRGRVQEAEAAFGRLEPLDHWENARWESRAVRLIARIDLHLARGRHAEALEATHALEDLEKAVLGELSWNSSVHWRLAIALHGAGRKQEAIATADRTVEMARRWNTAVFIGRALHTRAAVSNSPSEAAAMLEEAVAALRASVCRLRLALATVDYGAALRRAGRRVDAREVLREGLDLALACDATAAAERAREELRASGARLRRERVSGADALTPAERRIAYLAAEGFSNPEIARTLFLSRRTVENQLSRAYRKLDITAREQLPAALGQSTVTSGPP